MKTHRFTWADDVAAPSDTKSGRLRSRPATAAPPLLGVKTIAQHPVRRAVLPFNFPIEKVDTARWQIQQDSNIVAAFTVAPDSASPRNLTLRFDWEPEKTYLLSLLPGAVTDLYGTSNADTLRRKFNVLSEKALGDLNLTLKDLLPGTPYVLQLLNGTNLEEQRRFTPGTAEQKIIFRQLPAATYTARLVEDRNGNGRWDAGRYFDHRQPEPLFQKTLPALRANWEVEATMQAGENTAAESKKRGKE